MYIRSTLLPILGLSATGMAAYVLEDDYGTSTSFFDKFSFFTAPDPTGGFVSYVDRNTAQNAGLIAANGAVYMGVDHTNVASSSGRQSVRITSTKSYTHGLVILDLAHMPGGICGTWPAFWMVGPDWPSHGEIDIIEGVNTQSINQMTLHSTDGCTIANGGFTGTLLTSNCYDYAPGQGTNAGCGIAATSSQTYGTGFNNAGGGIYATEWTSAGISIWFFPRGSTPLDIRAGTPNPTNWGTPLARFAPGSCDFDAHFSEMQIVFDTTFCGGWAGGVWGSGSCASVASSCQDFVANNPSAFQEAYWLINSLKVYQDAPGASKMRKNATDHLHAQLPWEGGRPRPGRHGRGL
ncbi:hypothetical protein CNMCM6936_006166 [Aspergillus lentulus]|uniref:endo-1,3(4)-beta-glucanase n=1 Tax=Aspergillus lentulus TaxID=293939 RepID=A0AAN5YWW8_ASPLE|nr:hypothetical protein CNMCM6069_005246 [Aspergillus lentulus]KAF4169930.1 hypothetical protein CNMCM6936_006166 [Aspergillus lentulus]KAF4183163.1 hypothetical protein CNMCM8060_005190 [Aspergillus lentulus]KAF4190515.1 hypothetical protein CNMCM7927_003485 [Aspergillus lentulus]KAF4199478.1 hypothetical protein CNMCM8694_005151 [Aspergillus lentulus]